MYFLRIIERNQCLGLPDSWFSAVPIGSGANSLPPRLMVATCFEARVITKSWEEAMSLGFVKKARRSLFLQRIVNKQESK